jgi:hypothetical protein
MRFDPGRPSRNGWLGLDQDFIKSQLSVLFCTGRILFHAYTFVILILAVDLLYVFLFKKIIHKFWVFQLCGWAPALFKVCF